MAFTLVLLLITYLVQYPSLAAWELWLYLSCSVAFLESNTMQYCWNVAGLNIYWIRAQMNDFTYYVIYNGPNRSMRMFYLASFIFSHCHHHHSSPHCLVTVLLQWTSNWNQCSFSFSTPLNFLYICQIYLLILLELFSFFKQHAKIQVPSWSHDALLLEFNFYCFTYTF